MNIKVQMVVAGINILEQRKQLQERPHIIIGTPGRVHDMVKRDFLMVGALRLIILEEADEMLGRGFEDQVKGILKFVPMDVQMGIFSVTFPPELVRLTEICLKDPVSIVMKKKECDIRDVEHFQVAVKDEKEKMELLKKLCSTCLGKSQGIVLCRNREKVKELVEILKEKGLSVVGVHGEMVSGERCQILGEFIKSSHQILVTAGLHLVWEDVRSLASLMIHYDLPLSKEHYIGGGGFRFVWESPKEQTAISLVMPEYSSIVNEIESYYGINLKELPAEQIYLKD